MIFDISSGLWYLWRPVAVKTVSAPIKYDCLVPQVEIHARLVFDLIHTPTVTTQIIKIVTQLASCECANSQADGGSQLCQPFLRLSLLMAGHSIKSSLMHWCTMHAAETSHILQCKDHIGFRLATKGYSKHLWIRILLNTRAGN